LAETVGADVAAGLAAWNSQGLSSGPAEYGVAAPHGEQLAGERGQWFGQGDGCISRQAAALLV